MQLKSEIELTLNSIYTGDQYTITFLIMHI